MPRSSVLLLCFGVLISVCAASNLLSNPSFESGSSGWFPYHLGYSIDTTQEESGSNSIKCTSTSKSHTYGAYQVIKLHPPVMPPITISAYGLAASGLSGDGEFGIFAYVELADHSWKYDISAEFSTNVTEWQYVSVTPDLPDAVRQIWVYAVFEKVKGTVWFDDIAVTAADPATDAPVGTPAATRATTTTAKATTTTKAPTTTTTKAPTTTTTKAPTTTTTKAPTTTTTKAPTTTTTKATTTTTTSTTSTAAPTTTTSTAAPTTTTSTAAPTTTTSTAAPTTTTSTAAPTTTTTTAAPSYMVVGLRFLLVSDSATDTRLLAAAATLDSVGAPYDTTIITPNNTVLNLTAADGSGKYIGVISSTNTITYIIEPQLIAYQTTFNVKWVVMYSFPYAEDGVELAPGWSSGTSEITYLTFAPAASPYMSGYVPTANFSTSGAYVYPVAIASPDIASAALNVQIDSVEYIGAVFVNRSDGTRRLVFYVDQATWATHSTGLGVFWLQWLSNGLYVGLRRVYLNCQVDDLFMASDRWDAVNEWQHYTMSYRINGSELANFSNWQKTLNAGLPAGSNVTISFPFNGATIVQSAGGYLQDQLYITAKSLVNEFVFQTHTYDHPYLDNLTYSKVVSELTNNYNVTLMLFNSFQHPRYANRSMVTPSISGLFNGNALRALWDCGIRAVVGDNSRPELGTPFPYHGWYTNVTYNGFNGMYVMPREATNIYYDCSDDVEETSEYNHIYRSYFGYNSTFDQIIQREVLRVTQMLLAFRYDPHMFHQINTHQFVYNGRVTTLVGTWVEAVLGSLMQYYSLPVYSHNQDVITQLWLDRESRDGCGFNGQVNIDPSSKQIVSISGVTAKNCTLGITGADITSSATVTTQIYGPDKTAWVVATANVPFTLTLNTRIQT